MSTSTTSTAPLASSDNNNNGVGGGVATTAALPQLQYSVRSKTTVQSQSSPKYGKDDKMPVYEPAAEFKHIEYSRDGAMIAYVHATHVLVHRADTGVSVARIERSNVVFVSFSPKNSFLLTWERIPTSVNDPGLNVDNLSVWDLETGAAVHRTAQKHCNAEQWPLIRWTDDEMLAGRLVSNEIHFYNGRNIGVTAKKLRLPELASFEFAPGEHRGGYRFSVFVPERKGAIPGMCRIYTYPNTNEHSSHISFFKANEAKMFWNNTGDALLIHTATDTDKTGKSYYGETGLWFLSLDGTSFSLGIKGPIHDVKWAPNSDNFAVCYGNPFQSTLFNIKGSPLVDFGSAPRNTIRFSPNGKLLLLGGFGNLQGDMDFWDLTRYKRVASTTAHCAVYTEWAADSVHLLTAVLSPRIRVDNGIKLFKYDGTIVYKQELPELYQTLWRPTQHTLFPDEKIVYPSVIQLKETNSPPQKYTPPSLRAIQGSSPAPAKPVTPPSEVNPPGFKIHIPLSASGSPAAGSPGQQKKTTTIKQLSTEEQLEKRVSNLEKKVKEVETLKAKKEKGEPLPPKGQEKINDEQKLRDELKSLKLKQIQYQSNQNKQQQQPQQ